VALTEETQRRIWYLAPLFAVAVVFIAFAITMSNAIQDNSDRIEKAAAKSRAIVCLEVSKLSHTPTVAEMKAVGCDPALLPKAPVVVAPSTP